MHRKEQNEKATFLWLSISATETTGVIGARDLEIDSEDGDHARDYGYTPKVMERGRKQRSGISGCISGSSRVIIRSGGGNSVNGGVGGIQNDGSGGIRQVGKGERGK